MVRGSTARFLAAAVLAPSLLLVSACSDGDAGAEEPPSASASSAATTADASATAPAVASPSPSPTGRYVPASAEGPAQNVPLPVMPEEAKEFSKEGLEAFAEYFYEAANYAYESGDVEPIRRVSGPDCLVCNHVLSQVQEGFQAEDWLAKAQISVFGVSSEYVQTDEGLYQVLAQIQQDDIEYYSPVGSLGTDEGDSRPAVHLIEASHENGAWTAENVVTIRR